MQQLSTKEYEEIAEQIRGFSEEIELFPYNELPSIKEIAKELKRKKFIEEGITSDQLGCASESEKAVFSYYDKEKSLDDLFKTIAEPLKEGVPVVCHIVVFVKTIEERREVDSQKAQISLIAKEWLKNRKDGRKRSQIRFCALHVPKRDGKNFSITISSRIRALRYIPDAKEGKAKVASDVYIAKLYDIVNLYNHIGSELFAHNVRYHIQDILSVESEIQTALTADSADFFNLNNGIAIQIRNSRNLDRRNERNIRLTYSQEGDLSVINGAQTISAAADFFFRQVTDSSWQEAIEAAKNDAWVLLRIFYPDDSSSVDCASKFDQISISLNRQKPIAPMDIKYICPEVTQINSLYELHRGEPYYFQILKRGQKEHGRFQYQLSDFGRIVTAYYHNVPDKARSNSTLEIIQYSPFSDNYDDMSVGGEGTKSKAIYAPFKDGSDNEALFMAWYRPVNFAFQIANLYAQVEKEHRKKGKNDENVLTIL